MAARHARAELGEPAELWYRRSLGPSARVHGFGGASGRPRRRVATRVSIVSVVRKKDDLGIPMQNRGFRHTYGTSGKPSSIAAEKKKKVTSGSESLAQFLAIRALQPIAHSKCMGTSNYHRGKITTRPRSPACRAPRGVSEDGAGRQ